MQLRIAIASIGLISNDFLVSLTTLNPEHYKVVAVGAARADQLEAAKAFAAKFGIPKAYASYHQLACDPEIDLVYIGIINVYHFEAAKLMLSNGKSCLVEKPLTIEVDTTKELFDLANSKGLFLMEAMWSQFVPAYVKIREVLKSGEIGDLLHVQANFVMSTEKNRVVKKTFGGVYALNAIFNGVGWRKPEKMQAFGRQYNGTEGDVTVTAIFEFPGKVTASLLLTAEACKDNLKALNHVNYIGTKGTILVRDLSNNPQQIEVNGRVVDTSTEDGQGPRYNWAHSSGLRYQLEEIRKCLMEGRTTSTIHGPNESILLIETITKLMDDIGYSVKGMTPRDYEFKRL